MNWYLAKLVYQVLCGDEQHTAQFEEQLRLVHADDQLHAFHKARLIGEAEGMNYPQQQGIAVRWKFIDVTELLQLHSSIDGAEIYSNTREQEDAEMYIRSTHRKAKQLLQQGLHHFTYLNPS